MHEGIMFHLAYETLESARLIQIDTKDPVHLGAQGAIDQDLGRAYQKCPVGRKKANLARSYAARSSFIVVSIERARQETLMVVTRGITPRATPFVPAPKLFGSYPATLNSDTFHLLRRCITRRGNIKMNIEKERLALSSSSPAAMQCSQRTPKLHARLVDYCLGHCVEKDIGVHVCRLTTVLLNTHRIAPST